MKEDKSLEYRIKRLERLIRNQRKVKNESVGRKMFAYNTAASLKHGIYVITYDKVLLGTYIHELPRLWGEDGYSERAAVSRIFRNGNAIVVNKPCDIYDRPTVMEYGDFLDSHPEYDEHELSHLDFEDLVFVDKNDQVHELEFIKYDLPKYIHY